MTLDDLDSVSRDCPKSIYRAHRAIIFAIARLSCLQMELGKVVYELSLVLLVCELWLRKFYILEGLLDLRHFLSGTLYTCSLVEPGRIV